jgi:hypothetical protein
MIRNRSLLAYIFLRLYGGNLERSRRAEPEVAYSDALMQVGMFVGILVVSALWLVTALIWPQLAQYTAHRDTRYLVASIGFGWVVVYWIIRRCKQYQLTPGDVDASCTFGVAATLCVVGDRELARRIAILRILVSWLIPLLGAMITVRAAVEESQQNLRSC